LSTTRISEFRSKQEAIEDLREFLISIMPMIKSSDGCESVQLQQSQEDSAKFMMIEVWDSIESHQASVKNIPPQKLAEIQSILASTPRGGYYNLIDQKR
jgi:quinol monooxygenase YgiN